MKVKDSKNTQLRKPRRSKFQSFSSFTWLTNIFSENYYMLSTLQFVTELCRVDFVFVKALKISRRVFSAEAKTEADNTLFDLHNSSYLLHTLSDNC